MTQNIESMIEVLQAYKDGKKVVDRLGTVPVNLNQLLRWFANGMTVTTAPEPKKLKMEAWLINDYLVWRKSESKVGPEWIRVPSEDKEIEI